MKFIKSFEDAHDANSKLDPAEQDILRTLEQDWCRLTAQPGGSGRFDPSQLDQALPYAFMLERTAPGAVRTRVAGQRLHDILKMDPRGMAFDTFFTAATKDTVMRLTEAAFRQPAIVGIPLVAHRGLGRKPARAEALLLPMQDAHGFMTRAMGALVVSGPIGPRALRFDIAKDQPVRCDMVRRPTYERRRFRGKAAPAPAETVTDGKPALRLVVDNT